MAKTRLQNYLENRKPHRKARLENQLDLLCSIVGSVEHDRQQLDTVIGLIDEKQTEYHELTGRYYKEERE